METSNVTANPIHGFDINTATAKEFKQLVADFTEWCRNQPTPPVLGLTDGWTEFAPDQALNFLHHTVLSHANRRPSFSTVVYYAQQMRDADWKKTGQPMIIDQAGHGQDGQHRAWASVLTGKSFPTYVVASVPPFENLFAYIDNSKSRSAADALETAGMNGQARLLTSIVRLARHYDAGVMTPTSKGQVSKASPMEIMRYVSGHAGIREAAALMATEYQEATGLLLREHVAAFVGWKILERFGEDILDEFMRGLVAADSAGPNTAGNPLCALRKKLESYAENDTAVGMVITATGKKRKLTPSVQILAHIIKAFNAWHHHQAMRTISVRVDETFPTFTDVAVADEAA